MIDGCAPQDQTEQACCTGKARQERSVYTSQGRLPLRGKACGVVGSSAPGCPSGAAPVPALTPRPSVQELPPSQVLPRSHMFQVHPRPFSSSNTGPPHLVPGLLHKHERRRWQKQRQMGVGRGRQGSEQISMSSRLEEGLQGRQRWARQSGNETEGRRQPENMNVTAATEDASIPAGQRRPWTGSHTRCAQGQPTG